MGSTRRRGTKRRRRQLATAAMGRRADEPPSGPDLALRASHPAHFLNVASSFIGFGESTGLDVPPLHLKLADMAIDRSDVDNALFLTLAEMAPHADDRIHARSLADEMTDRERARLPPWLLTLGDAVPNEAARATTDDCDWHLWLLELRVGGHSLTAFLGIDQNVHLPAAMAATSTDSIERIVAMARHPSGARDASITDVPPAEAGCRILTALDRGEQLGIAPAVPYWPEPSALLRWVAGRSVC